MARHKGQGSHWCKPTSRLGIYFRDLGNKDDFHCAYCFRSHYEDGIGLTLDHVNPKGSNKPRNLVTSCGLCNASKGDMPFTRWLEVLEARGYDPEVVRKRVNRWRKRAIKPYRQLAKWAIEEHCEEVERLRAASNAIR